MKNEKKTVGVLILFKNMANFARSFHSVYYRQANVAEVCKYMIVVLLFFRRHNHCCQCNVILNVKGEIECARAISI